MLSLATQLTLCCLAAVVPGKTFLLVRAVIMRAIKAPESRHAILRFRFNHVKQAVILDTFPKVMRLCFPGLKSNLSKTDWYATLENGSEIWFGGLDDKERAEKILGMEFVTIYLNESSQIPQSSRDIVVTRLAQPQVEQKITGRPPVPLKPRILYDCNPPKKSHWTYKLFVKHVDPSSGKVQSNPEDFASFKINPKDNECNLSSGATFPHWKACRLRFAKRFCSVNLEMILRTDFLMRQA